MSDTNFQPIFDYIDSSVKELREDIISEVRLEMGDAKTAVANLSSQVTKYHEDMLVSGHGVGRLGGSSWIKSRSADSILS